MESPVMLRRNTEKNARDALRRENDRLEAEAMVLLRMGFSSDELVIFIDRREAIHTIHVVPKMMIEDMAG